MNSMSGIGLVLLSFKLARIMETNTKELIEQPINELTIDQLKYLIGFHINDSSRVYTVISLQKELIRRLELLNDMYEKRYNELSKDHFNLIIENKDLKEQTVFETGNKPIEIDPLDRERYLTFFHI